MKRQDWLCLAIRGLGLYFLARTILLIPTLINTIRMHELLLGPDAREKYGFSMMEMMGTSAIATSMGIFAIAAAVMFMIPCGRATPPQAG
jgi:hypothetical protein